MYSLTSYLLIHFYKLTENLDLIEFKEYLKWAPWQRYMYTQIYL